MAELKKVIFDMDGLIFDSERLFMREQQKILKGYGYDMTEDMYVRTLGLTGAALSAELREMFGDGYPEKEVTTRVRGRMSQIAAEEGLPVKPGIRELLSFLNSCGIDCVIASSSHTKYIEMYLKASGLDGYFSAVTGGECAERSKPAPDIFLKALGDTRKDAALVLEDSENGIRAANAAGIPVICIPDMVRHSSDVIGMTVCEAKSAFEVLERLKGMRVLTETEPKDVMRYFEEICSIPHGSGDTDRIAGYCEEFAREHSLECIRDAHNNVIIKKPASEGAEGCAPVIIQGHLDMVCAKTADTEIDFARDGLRLRTDGGYIWAEGTTLGGDDGIAVAMALAVLADEEIKHPPLECVFTSDEEIGMLGAMALDTDCIKGRTLINIDSEEEGIFTVSCAGGVVLTAELPITRYGSDKNEAGKRYTVTIEGLTGGHSGTEIDKGRENACVLLGRLLGDLSARIPFELVSINGGEKDNAIPRSAAAEVETKDLSGFEAAVAELAAEYRLKYGMSEPGLDITLGEGASADMPMYSSCKAAVIKLLCGLHNGVKRMSADIKDLVETSSNIGVTATDAERVSITVSVRSSVEEEKAALLSELAMAVTAAGGGYTVTGEYPAWAYKKDSRLRETAAAVYIEQYGSEPVISAIHAGLECGIFCGKLPGLDCISFGPNILDIHTPAERLDIGSAVRVYGFLKALLDRLGSDVK